MLGCTLTGGTKLGEYFTFVKFADSSTQHRAEAFPFKVPCALGPPTRAVSMNSFQLLRHSYRCRPGPSAARRVLNVSEPKNTRRSTATSKRGSVKFEAESTIDVADSVSTPEATQVSARLFFGPSARRRERS